MRIAMIGAGYVGLVSAACLADFGHDVVCVDKDAAKIQQLEKGIMPIYEPGLKALVDLNLGEGRLRFTTNLAEAIAEATAIFIAVGTPSRRATGHADLSFVYAAAEEIAPLLDGFRVVITKSTVPVGTGDQIESIIRRAAATAQVAVASNPEFLREGAAIQDFKHPDRIVVGVEDNAARAVLTEIYRPLHLNEGPLLFTTRRNAELIKYVANAYLATKITFINEIADLCERTGTDVQEVAKGIGLDKRIGQKFLNAGPGYGGSCLPKDTEALLKTAAQFGASLSLLLAVQKANETRKYNMARKVLSACSGSVAGKRIAVLGLTFKPNTDDMRNAPSLIILPTLQEYGADVHVHDPEGTDQARSLFTGLHFHDDPYGCIEGADALVIVTEWERFRALDLGRIKKTMRGNVLVDLRNIYRSDHMAALGFHYTSVGRGREGH